jgi:hypothetical protein
MRQLVSRRAGRASALPSFVRAVAIVILGAGLVVALVIGVVRLTGANSDSVAGFQISLDFEPKAGAHGGTAASAVKADVGAFGVTSSGTIRVISDEATLACYVVTGDGNPAMVSLVEIDGVGAGVASGASRWAGGSWEAAPSGSRATQCERLAPTPNT